MNKIPAVVCLLTLWPSAFFHPAKALSPLTIKSAPLTVHHYTSPVDVYSSSQEAGTRVIQDRRGTRSKKMLRPVSQHSRVSIRTAGSNISAPEPLQSSRGLTREEEIQYSFQIRTLRAAVRLRDQLVRRQNGMYIHPTEAEWAAGCGISIMQLRRVMHEGQEARGALVAANVGLVTKIAKKHYTTLKYATEAGGGVGTILTLQDMIQEGNLGLMEAAERYQPEKGFRFSTYATYWIRQRIFRSISDSSRIIRLPAHVHSMLQKIRKAKKNIVSETGRDPSLHELSQFLEVSEEKIQRYTDSSRNVVSLELPLRTPSFKEDSRTLGDTLASNAPSPEEDAETEYLKRDIRQVMDTALTDSEREVIVHRFGLEDRKPRTVKETAQQLGVSRDRIRLLEARALNKLRAPQRNYKLKEYIAGGSNSNDSGRAREEASTGASPDRLWFL